ncbi:MAG: class I tRNA ligase family protein, partial [Planctomycetota bacterium]
MSTATTIGDLAKSYDPASAEAAVRARWDAADAFHAEPDPDGRPYSIVIPPPNVTGALHAGHALNNTLQDILIRVHRMMGCNTLWMPGTDHAGIATQTVVEKRLLRDGKRRTDFSRAGFIEQVQAWKDEYEATITGQLTSLGASCDWARQRFTMDAMCARAVREAFFRLFDDELIYRGKRLVNWDPVTKTALADDEVEMRDVDGSMWYLQYQVVDAQGESRSGGPAHVTVATTRPETMLGDTAVAMNPRDPRAGELRGAFVRIPIVDRIVPIVEDDYVVLPVSLGGDPADAKAEIATGFLKVTPGHDPNDWEIGLRHDLPVINVMAPDASISADHGWDDVNDAGRAYIGLAREEARKAIVAWFDDNGLLESTREYAHSVGHSYRSHVAIEPFLSDQWYVRVSDDKLVGEAQRALAPEQFDGTPPPRRGATTPGHAEHDGGLRFSPPRYARSYQAWHDNLRDWCISRQLWWGHQIPVWSRHGGLPEGLDLDPSSAAIREYEGITHVCVRSEDDTTTVDRLESAGFERDPDVLDTWFSSGLWPLSTMGWPDPTAFPETVGLLETFNPTSVLCTGRDIITLWVSR